MPYLLRKIRKGRWYKTGDMTWLPAGDLQADALDDLKTASNELSVYRIDETKTNLTRVIAALSANTNFLSNIDYALLDEETLGRLCIPIKRSQGDSPDETVNGWHSDLQELSATKLLDLAKTISNEASIDRIGPKQVAELVEQSITMGLFERTRLKWTSKSS